jgi:hypothetical protein
MYVSFRCKPFGNACISLLCACAPLARILGSQEVDLDIFGCVILGLSEGLTSIQDMRLWVNLTKYGTLQRPGHAFKGSYSLLHQLITAHPDMPANSRSTDCGT